MNRFLTLCTILATACISMHAQEATLEPSTIKLIHEYGLYRQASNATDTAATTAPKVATLISFTGAGDVYRLTDLGIDITADLGEVVVAAVPIDRLEEVSMLPGVISVDAAGMQEPMLDYARPASQVTATQNGFTYDGRTVKLNGTGVICGMMDHGLEANHLNFKKADGTSRIKRLWHMTGTTGTLVEYNASNIVGFTTDSETETHGTHVGGIIGGYCHKNGKYVSGSTATTTATITTTSSGKIPYYGVATGADLAFACGELYNANTIAALTKIVEYAESEGKPCVINLSIGNTAGPHDGSTAYDKSLTALGKRAIICMSAGNSGSDNISIIKPLTTGTPLKTFIADNKASGQIDIWGHDSTPFNVTWGVYDATKKTVTEIVKVTQTNKEWGTFTPDNCSALSGFSGQIYVLSQTSSANKRFRVYTSLSITPLATNTDKYLCIIVEGSTGQKAYIYGKSTALFDSRSIAGFTSGSPDVSINTSCCADNIISVGSYTTRNAWPTLDGSLWRKNVLANYPINAISPFSSYGTSFQGQSLPHVTAPGGMTVSSYSRFYVAKNYTSKTKNEMSAQVLVSGTDYDYWGYMQGTSMSCPYVTGTIALWLEADPTLDFDRVMNVIKNTSTFSAAEMKPAIRWGAGKINALEGAKYVLANKSAIGSVWQDDSQRLIVSHTPVGLDIFVADTPLGYTATLYDLQGRAVVSTHARECEVTMATSTLAHGIYLLRIDSPTGLHLTHKLALCR